MANTNAPSGLAPVQYLHGNAWNMQMRLYYIPQTDTNAYAVGDPVASLTGAASAGGIPAVTLATAGASNLLRGVLMTSGGAAGTLPGLIAGSGFYDPNALGSIVIPATKTQPYFVGICDDPDVLWEVQEFSGSGSTNFTAADIGKGVNLKAGANNGYISGWTLDDTAASSTSNTRQVRLMGLIQRKDNAFGNYAKFLVAINQHELNFPSSGV